MRLLAIQELPQSKRVKLVFDDDSVLKTQPYLLADFGLYSGMDLTDEDYQALLTAAGKASAKARAVRIVAAAGVSEKELQKRLVQKGEEASDAQEAVGWLKELGNIAESVCQFLNTVKERNKIPSNEKSEEV